MDVIDEEKVVGATSNVIEDVFVISVVIAGNASDVTPLTDTCVDVIALGIGVLIDRWSSRIIITDF